MTVYELIKGEEENVIMMEDLNKKIVSMEEGYAAHQKDINAVAVGDNKKNKSNFIVNSGGREDVSASIVASKSRLVSLDVFRGLTVALMILVDDVGGLIPSINHSPWNGVTLADFVMPFFLFIVGVALALTYKRLPCRIAASRTAVLRALKLLVLGLLLQGGYFHGIKDLTFGVNMECFRLMGVLQFFRTTLLGGQGFPLIPTMYNKGQHIVATFLGLRIAIAYLVAALCEIWLKGDDAVKSELSLLKKYRFQWVVAVMLTITHMALLYGLYVPDWEYQVPSEGVSIPTRTLTVKCGVRGDTGPACNAVGMIDRTILGLQHLYQRPIYSRTMQCSIKSPNYGPLPHDAPSWCQAPFEPEGLLSSIMAIVSCMIGLHYGHVIVHFKDHKNRILHWMIPAFCLILMGFILDFSGMHLNKALYSSSYTCLTAGAAGILFTGLYVLVDVFGYRCPTYVLEWMGMHALMIYIVAACNLLPIFLQGFYWKKPGNNILTLIGIGHAA